MIIFWYVFVLILLWRYWDFRRYSWSKYFCEIRRNLFYNAVNFFQTAFSQAIIGSIVLTNYNNKTYRVDEVDYTVSPLSTFQTKKKGEVEDISYVDYYQKVRISDSECECFFFNLMFHFHLLSLFLHCSCWQFIVLKLVFDFI